MKKRIVSLVLVLVLLLSMTTNVFAAQMITLDLNMDVSPDNAYVHQINSIRAYTTATAWVQNQTSTTQYAALRVYAEDYVAGQGFVPVLVSETIVEISPNGQTYLSQFGEHFHNTGVAWVQLVSTGDVKFDGYFKYSDPNQ